MSQYHSFPRAPTVLVSGIAAGCGIPSITAAHVGRDGTIYLDVLEVDEFVVNRTMLEDLADLCEVDADAIETAPGPDGAVTIVVRKSTFDFSPQYLPGMEDSEESIEAHAALAASRRG